MKILGLTLLIDFWDFHLPKQIADGKTSWMMKKWEKERTTFCERTEHTFYFRFYTIFFDILYGMNLIPFFFSNYIGEHALIPFGRIFAFYKKLRHTHTD